MATGILSLVLSPESSQLLATTYASLPKIECHHLTVVYGTHELQALPDGLKGTKPGDSFTLRVFGIARSEFIEAVAVGIVRNGRIIVAGISNNKIPHVTLSYVPGKSTPFKSNALLEEKGFVLVPDGPELQAKFEVEKFES